MPNFDASFRPPGLEDEATRSGHATQRVKRGMLREPLASRAVTSIAAGVVLMLAICAVALSLGVVSRRQLGIASQQENINTALSELRDSLSEAESSQRGYILTGRQIYLAPYQEAVETSRFQAALLLRLTQNDAAWQSRVRLADKKVDQKILEMTHVIEIYKAGQHDGALALLNSDVGLHLFTAIKQDLISIQNGVRQSRSTAILRQGFAIRWVIVAIALSAAGAILAVSLAVFELAKSIRLLRFREAELDGLVHTLEQRVQARSSAVLEANRRFEIATQSAGVTVFSQNLELQYTWVSQSFHGTTAEALIGCTDQDIVPAKALPHLTAVKRAVLTTAQPKNAEICLEFDDATVWYDLTLIPSVDRAGAVTGLIGGALDITARKKSEAHIRLLMRELAHRSKNLLAVVLALTRQTVAMADSPEDFSERFSARLQSLASSYDLLIKEDWDGATMADLVTSQLSYHCDGDQPQIDASGPALQISADITQNLGMALHELATNAAKYGALSRPEGRVIVRWRVDAAESDAGGSDAGESDAGESDAGESGTRQCTITWKEIGGPPVAPPRRRGFGQVIVERTVARALGGVVALDYLPDGLRWELRFPLHSSADDDVASG